MNGYWNRKLLIRAGYSLYDKELWNCIQQNLSAEFICLPWINNLDKSSSRLQWQISRYHNIIHFAVHFYFLSFEGAFLRYKNSIYIHFFLYLIKILFFFFNYLISIFWRLLEYKIYIYLFLKQLWFANRNYRLENTPTTQKFKIS